MRSVQKKLVVVLGGVAVVATLACGRGAPDRPASTVIYGARSPRPDATGVTTRTTDSSGFVDNAGRTSEIHGRTEASGMRATETGSERLTGTPGSGTPLPIEARGQAPQVGEGAGALGGDNGDVTGAPGDAVVARVVRARCDRETACDRIGPDKATTTSEQCMSKLRNRARAEVVGAQCTRGFDNTQLALCLTTIRHVPCDAPLDAIEGLAHCQSSALCAQ